MTGHRRSRRSLPPTTSLYCQGLERGATTRTYRYEWGWRKSKFVNRSAGVSVLMKPRMHELARSTWMPPKELTGRAGAVRIKGPHTDITLLIVYFPPRTGESHLQGQYKECVEKLVGLLDKVVKEIPRRSLPVVLGDINDGFGMRRGDQGRWMTYEDRYVAWRTPQREHYAATKLGVPSWRTGTWLLAVRACSTARRNTVPGRRATSTTFPSRSRPRSRCGVRLCTATCGASSWPRCASRATMCRS